MNSRDLNRLAKNPRAMMAFQATGKLPVLSPRPSSPLITLLESIYPQERLKITNIAIGASLGYGGEIHFQNAAQALNWLKPDVEQHGYPSESRKDLRFNRRLTLSDLEAVATVPDNVKRSWAARHGHSSDGPSGP